MSYPMRQPEYKQGKVDPKTGGSITIIPNKEPDFDKFTKEDWAEYRTKELYNSNEWKKGIIGFLVIVIIGILSYYGW